MPRGAAHQTDVVSPESPVQSSTPTISGLQFPRFFSHEGSDPFDEIEWELRSAIIGNEHG